MILHILKTNSAAQRFYEHLGFTIAQDEGIRNKMI